MQQRTPAVKLQDLLRDAFASLPDGAGRAPGASRSRTIPVVRTSEDRSRMLQKVSETMAKRRSAPKGTSRSQGARGGSCSQSGLFDHCSDDRQARVAAFGARRSVISDLRELVAKAYRSMFRVPPEDYTIINPTLNAEFIERCRRLGATTSEFALNKTLLNVRKAGGNSDVSRETIPAPAREAIDECGHATEIAASILQREQAVLGRSIPSVDRMLCDPELRQRLDRYVQLLLGEADLAIVHFALLAFRKCGRASTGRLANVSMPERSLFASLNSLDPDDVPHVPGIYRITCRRSAVFVASTLSLHSRVCSHLQFGGVGLLPNEFPFGVDGPLSIEIFSAPRQWQPRRLEAIARAWRFRMYPALNIRDTGTLFSAADCIFDRRAAAG
jgi:hypothetical protein